MSISECVHSTTPSIVCLTGSVTWKSTSSCSCFCVTVECSRKCSPNLVLVEDATISNGPHCCGRWPSLEDTDDPELNMAPVHPFETLQYMERKISQHQTRYLEMFPEEKLKPKRRHSQTLYTAYDSFRATCDFLDNVPWSQTLTILKGWEKDWVFSKHSYDIGRTTQ